MDVINRDNFQAAVRFRDTFLLDRIFLIFDANKDGDISFQEFLACLSILSNKGRHPLSRYSPPFRSLSHLLVPFHTRVISTLVSGTLGS